MEEQPKRVLDLDKVESEKQKLISLIKPAIEQFQESTGYYPNIKVVISSVKTACGEIQSGEGLQISISI